jgi:hypothetical protein
LSNVEATGYDSAVCLAGPRIYESLLCFDHCAGLALVVDAKHLAPDLESAAFARYRNGLEEFELALAIEDMLRVELWYAVDGLGVGACVKVDYILICVLEWQNNWVRRKGSELRVEFLVYELALKYEGLSRLRCTRRNLHRESAALLGRSRRCSLQKEAGHASAMKPRSWETRSQRQVLPSRSLCRWAGVESIQCNCKVRETESIKRNLWEV